MKPNPPEGGTPNQSAVAVALCRRTPKEITMNEKYAELITGFPLFNGFTVNGTKRILDAGEVKDCAPGDVLLKEGDSADFALLVLTGTLEVFVERNGQDLILTEAQPGTILGELALICGIPRSASVRAKEPSTVLEWSDETLRTLLLRDRSLAQRIFRQALRTLIEKEQSLIDELAKEQSATNR
jgi:CRP-like cAMP-binding protein